MVTLLHRSTVQFITAAARGAPTLNFQWSTRLAPAAALVGQHRTAATAPALATTFLAGIPKSTAVDGRYTLSTQDFPDFVDLNEGGRPLFAALMYMIRWRKNQQFRGGVGNRKKVKFPKKWEDILPVINPRETLLAPPTDGAAATWLGHACMFMQWDGWNVLADPVFSQRCNIVQWVGVKRYRPTPLTVPELPDVDVVLISHTHYDHLDSDTINALAARTPPPLFCVPLGTKSIMEGMLMGVDSHLVMEFDWSEEATLPDTTGKGRPDLKIACLPAQHWSARTPIDGNTALWSSWACRTANFTYYFGGDTGYAGKMFKAIGNAIGPVDLAAIPIGAYGAPFQRFLMKPGHMDPEEAVACHTDLQAKSSVGIHWGTFRLTDEPAMEPKERLAAAVNNQELEQSSFSCFGHGETRRFPFASTASTPFSPSSSQ